MSRTGAAALLWWFTVVVQGAVPTVSKVGPFPTKDACQQVAESMERPWMGRAAPIVSNCYEAE